MKLEFPLTWNVLISNSHLRKGIINLDLYRSLAKIWPNWFSISNVSEIATRKVSTFIKLTMRDAIHYSLPIKIFTIFSEGEGFYFVWQGTECRYLTFNILMKQNISDISYVVENYLLIKLAFWTFIDGLSGSEHAKFINYNYFFSSNLVRKSYVTLWGLYC